MAAGWQPVDLASGEKDAVPGSMKLVRAVRPRSSSGDELGAADPEGDQRRPFDVVPAGMKFEPETVYDNRFVLKALGR